MDGRKDMFDMPRNDSLQNTFDRELFGLEWDLDALDLLVVLEPSHAQMACGPRGGGCIHGPSAVDADDDPALRAVVEIPRRPVLDGHGPVESFNLQRVNPPPATQFNRLPPELVDLVGQHESMEKVVAPSQTVVRQRRVDRLLKEGPQCVGQLSRSRREEEAKVDEPELLLEVFVGNGQIYFELARDLEGHPS